MSKPTCFALLFALMLTALIGCNGSSSSSPASFSPISNIGSGPQLGPGDRSATLQWDIPTQDTAGQYLPPSSIAGYKIYYGAISHFYSYVIDAGNNTSFTVSNLPAGTYYFAVTTYDQSGNESDFSNEVPKSI